MLPFTFTFDASLEVYEQSKQYLEEHPEIAHKLSELAWTYHSLGKVIPMTTENMFSGHFFPWHDSWEEIQVSYNLCLLGFYKQAMTSLRSSFELGLLSVYWNLNDDGHEVIQNWLQSQDDTPTPYFDKVWRKLEQHPNFTTYQHKHNIKKRMLDLKYLHDYVHSHGHKFSNTIGLLKSNKQTFEQKGFNKWVDTYEEIIKILSILHLIKYPVGVIRFDYSAKFGIDIPVFGGLHELEIDRLEKIIGEDAFASIQLIADSDSTVQDLIIWIKSLPNISEEKVQNQMIENDKSFILGMGFDNWVNMTKPNVDEFSDHERELYEQRVEYLRLWAKENGY
ncbi:hypothetical protein VB713_27620 [Anabaena cylindrica UHCC 0172]|uniref:hypothetical protein n=1 Tax=Anabaena cylindrica TaxID=1165 RepID=UPI002B1E9680|nr:hypothetical protein [Anabaena cylindrica]MEA5554701.1 hypothetical protein [Anabaena cylindrica UHCC 0172]